MFCGRFWFILTLARGGRRWVPDGRTNAGMMQTPLPSMGLVQQPCLSAGLVGRSRTGGRAGCPWAQPPASGHCSDSSQTGTELRLTPSHNSQAVKRVVATSTTSPWTVSSPATAVSFTYLASFTESILVRKMGHSKWLNCSLRAIFSLSKRPGERALKRGHVLAWREPRWEGFSPSQQVCYLSNPVEEIGAVFTCPPQYALWISR